MINCYISRVHAWHQRHEQSMSRIAELLAVHGICSYDCSSNSSGNLFDFITSEIASADIIIVYVTQSYFEDVESPAFSLAQLEFNTAMRRRSTDMIFVLLEPPTMNRQQFGDHSILNLAISSHASIDFSSYDQWIAHCQILLETIHSHVANNVHNRKAADSRIPILHRELNLMDIPLGIQQLSESQLERVKSQYSIDHKYSGSSNNPTGMTLVPLSSLSNESVMNLMDRLNLSRFKDVVCGVNGVTGHVLQCITTTKQLHELGITNATKARMLCSKLDIFRENGVPIELIGSTDVSNVNDPDLESSLSPTHAPSKQLHFDETTEQQNCQSHLPAILPNVIISNNGNSLSATKSNNGLFLKTVFTPLLSRLKIDPIVNSNRSNNKDNTPEVSECSISSSRYVLPLVTSQRDEQSMNEVESTEFIVSRVGVANKTNDNTIDNVDEELTRYYNNQQKQHDGSRLENTALIKDSAVCQTEPTIDFDLDGHTDDERYSFSANSDELFTSVTHVTNLAHDNNGLVNASSQDNGTQFGQSTSVNGNFYAGLIVEAKPKKMNNKNNYKYHRAMILKSNDDGTFDIMMKNDREIICNVPRFVLCRIEDIESRQIKRKQERVANLIPQRGISPNESSMNRITNASIIGSEHGRDHIHMHKSRNLIGNHHSTIVSRSVESGGSSLRPVVLSHGRGVGNNSDHAILPRIPRQFGNSLDDVKLLQEWVMTNQ